MPIFKLYDKLYERARMIADTGLAGLALPLIAVLAVTGVLVTAGCDSTETEDENPIADIAISPRTASLEEGEQMDFAVVALTASGDTVRNADLDIRWWSTDPAVFTVDDEGTAVGQEAGTAYCMVEASDEATAAGGGQASARAAHAGLLRFVGRDSAFVSIF